MNAKELKEVVNDNKKYLDIPDRSTMTQMIYFVSELLEKGEFKETAMQTRELANELDNMDTEEIIKEGIW